MKKYIALVIVFILSCTTLSCDILNQHTTTTLPITTETYEISLTKDSVVLPVNGEYLIDYQLNFSLDESEVISFETSDSNIAQVNDLGKILAHNPGECLITLSFDSNTETTLNVTVTNQVELNLPSKTIYSIGETLNLSGGFIKMYDSEGNVLATEVMTESMIKSYDPNTSGSQMVLLEHDGIDYSFEIYILSQKQELSTFNDLIVLNETLLIGEKIEFALTKSNVDEFLESVNVYDYNEINIYGIYTSPNGVAKKVYAFWYQDYVESYIETTIVSSLNTEGKVLNHDRDYDFQVAFKEEGYSHYRLRLTPEETGEYQSTIVVEVDGVRIQSFEKNFVVSDASNEDFKGFVRVDETNQRHFKFDNGESYIPVGQNVGWYTSRQRMHLDYKSWFEQMGAVDMNYARVWMAPWGYSVFWDDLYNYDTRQTRMYSLDKTLEYADQHDIYIQLCLLNHGMFSAETNPMWPNDENNWYISRYGSNPYSDILISSSLFFSQRTTKDLFKNQLKYIIARYGFSDSIMSFELFNEVDWIETYTALHGNIWHSEMAEYIKSIDPNEHLITTSQITERFSSQKYQVFHDENIDFISIHRYGIYNHTTYLPDYQTDCFNEFHKPVLYDEVGYQGWGGEQQVESDPNNVSLHQELWAGAMGAGAGTAMNWWWDTWIDQYNYYDQYQGIATFTEDMELSGDSYTFVTSEVNENDLLSNSSNQIGYMGYIVDSRVYLYVYDKDYAINHQNVFDKSGVTITIPNLDSGAYSYEVYNTFTGDIIFTDYITVSSNGTYTIDLPTFDVDIAIKIKKNN